MLNCDLKSKYFSSKCNDGICFHLHIYFHCLDFSVIRMGRQPLLEPKFSPCVLVGIYKHSSNVFYLLLYVVRWIAMSIANRLDSEGDSTTYN